MNKREYIKHLAVGQTIIVDNPMGHRTPYLVTGVTSGAGLTSVQYVLAENPDRTGWVFTRPSLSTVTIIEGN